MVVSGSDAELRLLDDNCIVIDCLQNNAIIDGRIHAFSFRDEACTKRLFKEIGSSVLYQHRQPMDDVLP